jgi:hypothetical protein
MAKQDEKLETIVVEPTTNSDILAAVQELTKAVGELAGKVKDLTDAWDKWRKAGKF